MTIYGRNQGFVCCGSPVGFGYHPAGALVGTWNPNDLLDVGVVRAHGFGRDRQTIAKVVISPHGDRKVEVKHRHADTIELQTFAAVAVKRDAAGAGDGIRGLVYLILIDLFEDGRRRATAPFSGGACCFVKDERIK